MTRDLFASDPPRPLAERLRPKRLEEVVGQESLLGPDGSLARMADAGRLASMILWGPPGTGKTTIARLLADRTGLTFEPLSAVFSGVADLRKVFDAARQRRQQGLGTLLFVDEIHRFNRAQQDALLPHVEDGTVVLVGATTENPSFELNAALLSRCQVMVLSRLADGALETLLQRAEAQERRALSVTAEGRSALRAMADGDGRYLINMAESLFGLMDTAGPEGPKDAPLDAAGVARAVRARQPLYDKAQDSHFNLISALHKALRGSDVDAALYWLARMLAGGEEPLYIARRLVRFASEDIGLADPQALAQALAAWDAYERLGSPEGELAIAQAVAYLGTAAKSNALYTAYKDSLGAARETGSLMPPRHSLNAPTALMRELGYGAGYAYDPESQESFAGQDYFPEEMSRRAFYRPSERGYEQEVARRLAHWESLRRQRARG